jgi:membrane-associated phospholipid phosphatase
VDVGSDGGSLAIEPPLSFSIRHEGLRLRLPLNAIGESPGRFVLMRTRRPALSGISFEGSPGERVSDLPVDQAVPEPPAERLARRLESRPTPRPTIAEVLHELGRLDLSVYRAIAMTPTPTLDEPLRRISEVASRSKLWLGIAAVIAIAGGRNGRRAALTGVAALAIDSVAVNLAAKLSIRRGRPDPASAGVPEARRVEMPSSPSFPSGHAASSFAFAEAVAETMPVLAAPLRVLAAIVAYSRVHTGVHYPGDVIAGSLIGSSIGQGVGLVARAIDLHPC